MVGERVEWNRSGGFDWKQRHSLDRVGVARLSDGRRLGSAPSSPNDDEYDDDDDSDDDNDGEDDSDDETNRSRSNYTPDMSLPSALSQITNIITSR